MPKPSLLPPFLLAAAILSVAPRAVAEATPQEKAAAEALYVQAGKLGDEQKWAEAMAKLEASQALDPALGTLNRLALCAEKLGLLATAYARWNEMAALARRTGDKREEGAAANAKRLEPLLPTLVIAVASASTAGDLEIRKDGTVIKSGAWGVPVPVDAGPHRIEATRPGKQAWQTTVTVDPKPGVTTVQVPALADMPAVVAPVVLQAMPPFWGPRRVAGASVAAAGVVGVAIGAALGAAALNKASQLKSSGACNAELSACSEAGMPGWRSGQEVAHGATAALVVGGAALAGGVVLFATGGAGREARVGWVTVGARLGVGEGGVVVQGGW